MIFIAHRGNIDGPSEFENSPGQVCYALNLGFHAEVDVWYVDGKFMLGHDKPTYEMGAYLLYHERVWRHAKNIEAFNRMLHAGVHCFWHDKDDYTLTSKGFIWAYPGKPLSGRGIAVLQKPGLPDFECEGICSDFVGQLSGSCVTT